VKKLLLPFIFCLFAMAVAAQPAETVDAKANGILQSLDKKTKTYKTIQAEFTYTQYDKDRKPGESQKGAVWIKGAKYKLDIKNQIAFCDSSTTWTYLKDANEVQINKVDPSSNKGNLSPATIFTLYEKGFKSHFIDEEKVNNVLCECVELYPKHPEKEKYHTLRLFIDKTKNQIIQITQVNKDGTSQIYSIDKFSTNIPLADTTFTFDKKDYPGVEIEDLRE
jgi:outer membrane lipoprotein-sorting protein